MKQQPLFPGRPTDIEYTEDPDSACYTCRRREWCTDAFDRNNCDDFTEEVPSEALSSKDSLLLLRKADHR